ncbi:uncharacterized protein LOC112565033 isoform X3 [Pomacea canaliculata]|uniref:uncharacterized protein LOC112565033 isoform X3 n=1 Tax=Pomacea canaliculata TaxID=400727 RepID=UPI000D72AF52|nr:uncharacterized protein LOC112565033 isoform X3 [Pomacea canaliculata]
MKSFALGLLVLYLTGSLALFAWSPVKKRQNTCDESQVMQCISPLEEYLKPLSGSKLEELSDAQAIEQQCSLLVSSKGCINNYISDCYPSEVEDLTIQTLESVLGYLCSAEGKDALLTESKCIANADFERSMQHCSDLLDIELEQAFLQSDSPTAVCRPIENFTVCVGEKVRAECSQKAVNFVRNLVSRLTAPLKNMMGCDNQARLVRDLVKLIARRK